MKIVVETDAMRRQFGERLVINPPIQGAAQLRVSPEVGVHAGET